MEGPLPLSDWPNSLNSNWFSDVVRFAAIHSPLTLSLLVRLCVKEMSRNVQERHVINVATVYSQIAMMVDKKNNALTKINTLQMMLQGLGLSAFGSSNRWNPGGSIGEPLYEK